MTKTSTMKPFAPGDIFLGCTYLCDPNDDHAGEGRILQFDRDRVPKGTLYTEGTTHLVVNLRFGPDGVLWAFDPFSHAVVRVGPSGEQLPAHEFGDRGWGSVCFAQDGCVLLTEYLHGDKPYEGGNMRTLPGTAVVGYGRIAKFDVQLNPVTEFATDLSPSLTGFHGVTHSAMHPDGRHLAFMTDLGMRVMRIDTTTGELLPDLVCYPGGEDYVRKWTTGVAYLRDGTLCLLRGSFIDFIDADGQSQRTIKLDSYGYAMITLSADDQYAYVTNIFTGVMSRVELDSGTIVGTIDTGLAAPFRSLAGVAVFPDQMSPFTLQPVAESLIGWYEKLFIRRPRLALAIILVVVGFFAAFAPRFHLDASGDSLLLENDADLRYYRNIRARYGSDEYLVITYTPERDLFADETLARLQSLRDELAALDGLATVTTILDVPLLDSPPISLEGLQEEVPTLLSERTDRQLARQELTESSLYRQLLTSVDGRTTALLATFRLDPEYLDLLSRRDDLREKMLTAELTTEENARLEAMSEEISELRAELTYRQQDDIAQVREILDRYRSDGEIRLGGIPMIVTDMLDYIRRDVVVFGAGILVFLIGLLAWIFVRPRWVVIPMASCLLSALLMVGGLGLTDFPVTVVSANFVALLLIFSLSITVHLIVRYRELHAQHPQYDQGRLVALTVRDKFLPCLFTALTTIVAFASLLVSGIRPVMDFGWMMVVGMLVVLATAFTVFPSGLMLLDAGAPQQRRSFTAKITGLLAGWIDRRQAVVAGAFIVTALISLYGITQVTVENRFIDNFKSDTEIYRGMVKIDQELGGTTPLDVIIDADPAHFVSRDTGTGGDDEFEDEFADEFEDEFAAVDDLGSTSYWYNTFQMKTVSRVHDYLDSLPETGKILSMATTIDTLQTINDDEEVSTFWLSILYKKLPDEVKDALFDPYMSADGNQVRFAIRVFESDKSLRRDELIERIREYLTGEMGFAPDRVRLTGMLVLYNNVLQSLYKSQILTLGFVFGAILLMFMLLYRSLSVALIALVPNFLAAGAVLGLMGLLGIPLDIMTITIAAIVIGIGVDDTIHYLHRFKVEFAEVGDYHAAAQRSHGSIGRAMYYTSIIIAVGFSILVLSNFLPTIYFGILTGFAMLFAMIANLTILPLLLIRFQPLGEPAAA